MNFQLKKLLSSLANAPRSNGLLLCLVVFLGTLFLPAQLPAAADFSMKGWATVGQGTTGGKGGATVTVSNPIDFINAISSSEPLIIYVDGTIDFAKLPTNHGDFGRIRHHVTSNKSILGLGSNARIRGGDLSLRQVSNVIIRNITFDGALDTSVGLRGATHVWIDHNTFTNSPDGLLDITQAADLVTVSWNHFHNHNKTSLVGSSDGMTGDRGRLRVTYYNNWFETTRQRHPRVRYGNVHVFNNYFTDIDAYALGVGVEAQVISEHNYIDGATRAWRYYDTADQPGYIRDTGSIVKGIGIPESLKPNGINWDPKNHYDYTVIAAGSVPALVTAYSGVGIIDPLSPDQPPPVETPEERDPVGLIAHFPLTEGSGNTARDQSGFGTPLDLTLAGGATWLSGGGVALGGGEARLLGEGSAAKLTEQIMGTGQLSVEIWAKPGHLNQPDEGSHPSRILSLTQDNSNRNFMIGHGGHHYQGPAMSVRLRTTSINDDENGLPNIVASDTIANAKSHYMVTFDGTTVRIYRDGTLKHSERREGTLANWDPTYRLILGNEIGGNRGWVGEIYGVSIFDYALSEAEIQQRASGQPSEGDSGEAGSFANWLQETFPDGSVTDPMDDPGGHGIPLLVRYTLGLDPHNPNRDSMHELSVQPNPTSGNHFLTIEFNRIKGEIDTTVVVEVSDDLHTWKELGPEATVNVVANGKLERVTVRDTQPMADGQQRFMRLRIDQTPGSSG